MQENPGDFAITRNSYAVASRPSYQWVGRLCILIHHLWRNPVVSIVYTLKSLQPNLQFRLCTRADSWYFLLLGVMHVEESIHHWLRKYHESSRSLFSPRWNVKLMWKASCQDAVYYLPKWNPRGLNRRAYMRDLMLEGIWLEVWSYLWVKFLPLTGIVDQI